MHGFSQSEAALLSNDSQLRKITKTRLRIILRMVGIQERKLMFCYNVFSVENLNYLLNDKILDSTKLKAFPDHKLNVAFSFIVLKTNAPKMAISREM